MAIKKVSQETKKVIRENSVLALPDKPSEKGYTAQQLKEYFTNLVLGDKASSLAELDRVVQEINDLIGSIEDTTVQKYVIDTVVGKFVEQAPYVSLKFEDNKLKYTKFGNPTISGEIDTVPNDSVFFNSETLKSKSGETIYPKTTSSNVIIGDTNVEKLLLDLQSKLNELEQNHEVDIKTIEDDLRAIVGGDAPAALNSIKELAEALKNNPSSIDDILIQLSNLSTNKVDKISGKGLSTNDYDNTTKAFVDELKSKDVALKTDIKTKLSEMQYDYHHRTVGTEDINFWNSKADGNHTQNISTINGLPEALENKSDVGHTHTVESLGIDFAGISEQIIAEHNKSSVSHQDIRDEIKEVKNKVDGINNALSFENVSQLTAWFGGTYNRADGKKPSDLYVGQHIYLKDQDEDDYWVSVVPANMSNLSVLKTDKIDLSEYAQKNELKRVAFTGSYTDLENKPSIPTTLADLSSDAEHAHITQEQVEQIETNKNNIANKLDKALGSSEANKMIVTDSEGNVVTAEAGSMAVMVDNLNSTSTDMALAANQGRVLDNKKLDKQQGIENAGKVLAVNDNGVVTPASGYATEQYVKENGGKIKVVSDLVYLDDLENGTYICQSESGKTKVLVRKGPSQANDVGFSACPNGTIFTLGPGSGNGFTNYPRAATVMFGGRMYLFPFNSDGGETPSNLCTVSSSGGAVIYGKGIYQNGKKVAIEDNAIKHLTDTAIVLYTLDTGIYVLDNDATLSVSSGVGSITVGAGTMINTIRRGYDLEDGSVSYVSCGEIMAITDGSAFDARYNFNDEQGNPQRSRIAREFVYRSGGFFVNGVSLIDKIYPVGSIYMSINNVSPASFIGGTWEPLPEGYALWTASSGAGETIAPGLPNITGSFGGNQDQGATGAFYKSKSGVKNSGMSSYACVVQIDASRSSSIYGASSTVQPPAYKIYAWKRQP